MKKKNWLILAALVISCSINCHAYAEEESEIPTFTLNEINVTALGYQKGTLDTPSDIEVYQGEDLKKTGASDVANALKYKAGIIFTQMGPHDQSFITGNSTVNLRGIKGGTLVLINGVPAAFNNVSHLDLINLDTVEKVEILKGGGAVLYGSEAYGGIINVITKDNYQNNLRIAAGNKGQKNYSATIGVGKLGISLERNEMGETGNMSLNQGTKTINGVKVPYYTGFGDSKKDHLSLNYKFDDKLNFSYMFNKKKYTIDYNDIKGNKMQHFMYDDKEHFAQLHFDDQKGLLATAYYNARSIKNPDYYIVKPTNLEWERSNLKNYGLDLKKIWSNQNEKILIGAKANRELYVDENQKFTTFGNSASSLKNYARFGTYSLNGYSLYGQYDRKISDATNIVFSMREDLIRSDAGNYDAFLPQLQVITKIDEQSSLYVNIGRSFRMPTFRQLYYSSGVLLDNPDLKPEYGWNYEAGYKHITAKEEFKAAVFRIDLKDQITTRKVNINGTSMTQSYNAAKYKNAGIELSYTRKISDNFNWTIGGIYNHPQNKDSNTTAWKDVLGKYQIMTSLDWQHNKTNMSLNLSYTGDRVNNSKQTDVKPLLLSNFHLGQEISSNATLTLDINNIFNRHDLTDPDGYYLTQGRTFILGVNYSF